MLHKIIRSSETMRNILMKRIKVFALPILCFALPAVTAPTGTQPAAGDVSVGSDNIGGLVRSSQGPEAGVWVIAETADLPTKFRKIVVTNDRGQFLLPDLPSARYKIWVRGYGLVDSDPVEATPGKTLALKAALAPTPRAGAQYFPASYWISLLDVPPQSAFPLTIPGPHTPAVVATQTEWLYALKGCYGCHQMGSKSTREIPASWGTFGTSSQAWERFISSGQVGQRMMDSLNRFGHDQALAMFADWGDRIAKGELPPVPPRPEGAERCVVVTVWDWSVRASFLHALTSTDQRNPSVNADGPIYGADWSAGALAVLDPVKNTKAMIEVPLPNEDDRKKFAPWSPQSQLAPSVYFGDELVWKDPVNPGAIAMDARGRVWFNVQNRLDNPAYCKSGSRNPYAKYSPRESGGVGVDIYDPKTRKFEFIDQCVKTERLVFADDKDQTLYFAIEGNPGGIGWVNTRVWDEVHDSEKSQGWCSAIVDYDGDGIAYNAVDDSIWYAALNPRPGRLIRMTRGSNPPSTCMAEAYEPSAYQSPGMGGSHARGIDIDTNGVVWTPLAPEGNLASFDRRKCKALTKEAATTGPQCPEGWSFYAIPGAAFKAQPHVKSDYNNYVWVDRYNSLGLGNNIPVVDGANSDSLLAFQPKTRKWVRMQVPYPMGFFSRFFDGRIDNANAGWKGRGLWAANETRGSQLTEGGASMPSQLVHFQIRPNPLAK
jgi:hypothetical protein